MIVPLLFGKQVLYKCRISIINTKLLFITPGDRRKYLWTDLGYLYEMVVDYIGDNRFYSLRK